MSVTVDKKTPKIQDVHIGKDLGLKKSQLDEPTVSGDLNIPPPRVVSSADVYHGVGEGLEGQLLRLQEYLKSPSALPLVAVARLTQIVQGVLNENASKDVSCCGSRCSEREREGTTSDSTSEAEASTSGSTVDAGSEAD